MEQIPKQVYTDAFRGEAVKLVLEKGLLLSVAARQLAIPKGTLSAWVKTAKHGGSTALKSHGTPVSEVVRRIRG